jgi:hypothetical protein
VVDIDIMWNAFSKYQPMLEEMYASWETATLERLRKLADERGIDRTGRDDVKSLLIIVKEDEDRPIAA